MSLAVNSRPSDEGDADFAGVLDDVVVGEDVAVGRDDDARAEAVLAGRDVPSVAAPGHCDARLLAEEPAEEIRL